MSAKRGTNRRRITITIGEGRTARQVSFDDTPILREILAAMHRHDNDVVAESTLAAEVHTRFPNEPLERVRTLVHFIGDCCYGFEHDTPEMLQAKIDELMRP